ncbi:MAG: OB-fold nucleic acid binding domain-containing protein [Nanoarchaeota archaeon]|nr:OB-fold nucleic acid binding domain-containing protein [Nanoarchaeota archaeon]
MAEGDFKRQTAYKIKIGDVARGRPIFEGERFSAVELEDKRIVRVNIVANIIERYLSDDKNYLSLTIDDASGQIRIKVFKEDIARFESLGQGDTVMVMGLLRSYNNEIYINPEIITQKDPRYLLVRKLEFERNSPKLVDNETVLAVADKVIQKIKSAEPDGIAGDKLIVDVGESGELINQEIRKALEQGVIYEPRPGVYRYLGNE